MSNLPVFIAPLFCLLVLQSPPAVSTYRLEPTDTPTIKKRYTAEQLGVLEKLNRRDLEHLIRLDAIVVPDTWTDELSFSPLPADWPAAQAHAKALVVDQPSQLFGAYEAGKLVRWGPVSSGRKETPTPAGEFTLTLKTTKAGRKLFAAGTPFTANVDARFRTKDGTAERSEALVVAP